METPENREYDNIPAGLAVRGSINNEYIFRVRPGNGQGGSLAGKVYQDKYAYFVPSSINNPEGQTARDALIAAVTNWQGFTPTQKTAYNDRAARRGLKMSGYNLYVKEYVRANA